MNKVGWGWRGVIHDTFKGLWISFNLQRDVGKPYMYVLVESV
ncbi:unnamed protein product [Rhodiola kirilowii]